MTHEEKLALYREGKYVFATPPVCTVLWDTLSWVNWIDMCEGWRP